MAYALTRPDSTYTDAGYGTNVGSANPLGDGDDATYTKVLYEYPDWPDTGISGVYSAEPAATAIDLTAIYVRMAPDPSNIYPMWFQPYLLSPDYFTRWNLTYQGVGGQHNMASGSTTYQFAVDPAQDTTGVLPMLQANGLQINVVFGNAGPLSSGVSLYAEVYDAWLMIDSSSATGYPPLCRKWPVPLGRHWPPQSAQQLSARRAGGYY